MRETNTNPPSPAARALMVGDHEARVQPISGADVEVLGRLWQRLNGLSLTTDEAAVAALVTAMPEALDALAQLSGIERQVLAGLHLAALLGFGERYVRRWLDENAGYIADELVPVIVRVGAAAGEIIQGLKAAQATTDSTAPASA